MFKGLRKKASVLSLYPSTSNSSTAENASALNSSSNYDRILKQVHDFETALKAMDYLLDDRTDEGTSLLKKEAQTAQQDNSPRAVFPLALGVMEFIEATLGFEPEVMAKAHKTLSEAENASSNNSKYNTRYQLATSTIYPPGTEFQVTLAESTLLNALLMLLKENNGVVESAKALFKLRKAYQILDSVHKRIQESEPVFNKNLAKLRKKATTSGAGKTDGVFLNNNNQSISTVDLPGFESSSNSSSSLPQDIKLMKDLEKIFLMRKARIEGSNLGNTEQINLFEDSNSSVTLAKQTIPGPSDSQDNGSDDDEFEDAMDHLAVSDAPNSFVGSGAQSILSSVDTSPSSHGTGSDTYLHVSTTDEFIHSGVQLCFGILQVVLSLIPPAIGAVLSIVGFKGNRNIGLQLLWRTAITSRNVHGELALLFLLVFYDGPVQFVDTGFRLPESKSDNNVISLSNKLTVSEEELGQIMDNPQLYTNQLLRSARQHFPHNALWILQEGRMLAAQGDLVGASTLMQNFTDDPNNKIQMKQIESLLVFDRAVIYMYMHEYDKAARDLIHLIDINSWSKAVYLFMAASCYLENYRMIKMGVKAGDAAEAKKYADLFSKYMNLSLSYVPGHGHNAPKKGGLGGSGKQMPFDKFLLRKHKHIESRKKQYPDVQLADLVGTSLIHELVYFWNGYNRMTPEHFEIALKMLGYSGSPNAEFSANSSAHSFAMIKETEDEAMIRYFLQSVCLRQLGQVKEGSRLLQQYVLSKIVISDFPQFKFHKMTYSPYLYPTAFYENTMFTWVEETGPNTKVSVKTAVAESKAWLKKAEIVGDGDYELSNRTSMRIKAAGDRLDQLASV
ncbi:IML2 [Candida margitis]|uniref:IML2 n=1 Tax=Candida margitis TaxID=1775924 RepID=UPI0022263F1D|nr:IML2 [Candida margitis]KAI5967540.1 IML2 [Candida margitis]